MIADKEKLLKEYELEKNRLDKQGKIPYGVNEHLESFKQFLDWKKRNFELFTFDDRAKDLI